MLVVVAALLFSTGGAAVKAISLSGGQVAALRSGIAFVALLLVVPGWRRFWQPRTLLVGLAYGATMVLYVLANKRTHAANAIFLQGTAPIYVLALGPLLLRERTHARQVGVALIMAAGLGLFFVDRELPSRTAFDPTAGNLLAAASGLSWALTIVGLRWLGSAPGSSGQAAGQAVVAGNLVACLGSLRFAVPLGVPTAPDLGLVLYLGLFQIALAYVCLTRAVRHVPAVETSLLLLLEPVGSVFWAWLFHGERPGFWPLAGCATIFVATLMLALPRKIPGTR